MVKIDYEKLIANIVSLFALVTCALLLFVDSDNKTGYEYLFMIPGLFALYYPLSNLKKIKLRNFPVTIFRVTLIIRVVLIPFLMVITDTYTVGFYSSTSMTSYSSRVAATFLFLYEFIAIIITSELCIKKYGINNIEDDKSDEIIFSSVRPIRNTAICWVAVIIGVIGYLVFPAISNRVYFILGNDDVAYEAMSFVPALFFEFTKITFLVLFLVFVNKALSQKQRAINNKPTFFVGICILVFAILLIGTRMSSNRMTILRNSFFCLEFLLLVYPHKKKTILVVFGAFCAAVVLSVSAFKWLGESTGNMNLNIITNTFGEGGEAKFFQMYFNGVDGIAYGVSLKEHASVTFRTFINDTFRNTAFLNQLITSGDTVNTSILYNTAIYGESSRLGVIIPMVTQCSMYFGYIFSPLYSIICVRMLFYACKKRQEANSLPLLFLWFGIALEFGSFQGYNYSLVVANIFNNVFLPYFILSVTNKLGLTPNRLNVNLN